MADGWRRLLEEESEHQWLTLAMFTAFVVVGAFAINATEHFVGDRIAQVDALHKGALVVHIEYHDDGESYTALVFSPSEGTTCSRSLPTARTPRSTRLNATIWEAKSTS